MSALKWVKTDRYYEATVGDFAGQDGVRFTLTEHPSCYRRGIWRLLIEVAHGPNHLLWGCFDEQDQPQRHYHLKESALCEAQAIADVLLNDRKQREALKR